MNNLRALIEFAKSQHPHVNFSVESLDGESDMGMSVTILYSSHSDGVALSESEVTTLQDSLNEELIRYENPFLNSVILKETPNDEADSLEEYVASNKESLRELIDKARVTE